MTKQLSPGSTPACWARLAGPAKARRARRFDSMRWCALYRADKSFSWTGPLVGAKIIGIGTSALRHLNSQRLFEWHGNNGAAQTACAWHPGEVASRGLSTEGRASRDIPYAGRHRAPRGWSLLGPELFHLGSSSLFVLCARTQHVSRTPGARTHRVRKVSRAFERMAGATSTSGRYQSGDPARSSTHDWRYRAVDELVDPQRAAWPGRQVPAVDIPRAPGKLPLSDSHALLAAAATGDDDAVRLLLARGIVENKHWTDLDSPPSSSARLSELSPFLHPEGE